MLQVLKGWVVSWIRLGYPLFPLRDQGWIRETIPAGKADVVVANTLWFPLGRLHAVPRRLEGEFRRRMRKLRVSRGVLGTMVAVLGLAPLMGDSDAVILVSFLAMAFTLGVVGPLWTYGFRVRKFVRTEMTRVHPTSAFAWKFRAFYFAIAGLFVLYGVIRGLIEGFTEQSGGREAGEATSQAADALEGTLGELVSSPFSPFKALGIAILKAVGGLIISATGAGVSVWISDAVKRSEELAIGLLVLALVGGFSWGYWYYIRKERKLFSVHAGFA